MRRFYVVIDVMEGEHGEYAGETSDLALDLDRHVGDGHAVDSTVYDDLSDMALDWAEKLGPFRGEAASVRRHLQMRINVASVGETERTVWAHQS